MKKPENPLAFPVTPTDKSEQSAETQCGMTLRDYFAAKAMASIISLPDQINWTVDEIASDAYDFADAMLSRRIV